MENKDFISYKEKITKLFKGIIYFLETYSKLMKKKKIDFKFTNFIERLKEFYNNLSANLKEKNVLDEALNFLKQYNFDIINQDIFLQFFDLILEQEDYLIIITLNYDFCEIMGDVELDQDCLSINGDDISNALDIYHFFEKIKENISDTDEKLFSNFNIALNDNKDFYNKFKNYTIAYKEIMYLL